MIGARPGRAKIVEDPEGILNGFEKMSETERTGAVQKFAEYAAGAYGVWKQYARFRGIQKTSGRGTGEKSMGNTGRNEEDESEFLAEREAL